MSKDDYADLPRQLREQALEADRAVEDLSAGKTPGIPDDPAPHGAPAADEDLETKPHGAEETLGDPASEEPYEQRYKVLQGKYDKEVPELNQKLRSLHIENTELQRRMSEMEQALAGKAGASGFDGVSPGDYEEYGEEFVKLANENRRLEKVVEEMRGDFEAVKKTTAESAHERFIARLSELKVEWQAIDSDPAFDVWLHETGNKQDYISAASVKNVQKVVDLMDLYLMRTGKTYGNNDAPKSPSQARQIVPVDIESQVQPTSTGSTGHGSDAVQGRVYTKAEINEFFDRYAKGQFPFSVGDIEVFNEEDGARIDQDMTRANAEGRIVG